MARTREKPPLERTARALCQLRGLPDDFRRLVLDQPWPGPVPADRQEPDGGGDS